MVLCHRRQYFCSHCHENLKSHKGTRWEVFSVLKNYATAQVFRRDSPLTQSRRNTGSGGERSSMLTRVEYKEECFYNWTWDVCSHWKQMNYLSQHPSTFTNGPGQPLRSSSWTVTSKYPSCTVLLFSRIGGYQLSAGTYCLQLYSCPKHISGNISFHQLAYVVTHCSLFSNII
jgi:hypothetical protein